MTATPTVDQRVLYPGTARLPVAASPDLRGRSYRIEAELGAPLDGAEGVLVACGDAQAGFTLFVRDAALVHLYRHGGRSTTTTSEPLTGEETVLAAEVTYLGGDARVDLRAGDLVIGGGSIEHLARARVSYAGLDVGRDRGMPVGDYDAPFPFTGSLSRIVIRAGLAEDVDAAGSLSVELATG